MTFEFIDKIPHELSDKEPVLVSGFNSLEFSGRVYLIVSDIEKNIFEIRYEYHCSPFKEALIYDNILAIGFEEKFYLFNLLTKTNILALKMYGYFCDLYLDDSKFYVTDPGGIHCIDMKASVLWNNNRLGIDGVIINEFSENTISGSGEWDPPGGWEDFTLDRHTGVLIK